MLYPYQSTRRFIPDDCRRCAALLALAFASCAASATVTVDGRIDAEEWRGARHITDFRKVEPFNGEPARLPVEAWRCPPRKAWRSRSASSNPRPCARASASG